MAWTIYDDTGKPVISQGDFSITITGDSGTDTISNNETIDFEGGAGIGTAVTSGKVTINNEYDYENILGSSGSFDVTLATDVPTFDSSVKTIIIDLGIRSLVSATTDVIYLILNNDTTIANYHRQVLASAAGAAAVGENADPAITASAPANTSPASSFWFARIVISMVNSTSYLKVTRIHGGGLYDTSDVRADAGMAVWKSTSAITRIQVRTDNHPTDLLATNSFFRMKVIK